ncbi:OPI10-like protein isoform B [Micractinium conductrix]|uniref:OPI10-like protein isoform B n=1 Tax=Micractinium conductrix TaxID=554055 RepID=A0A2P6VIN2_9CHLO|nr:OPI10-like protein isoform B [Micractinium conductrix]|eukprot:PSC73963.1 OPI10-like protein isoform B [Micractinium conductrix]
MASSSAGGDLVAQINAKNSENSVMVYSKTYCPYCSEVKSLFNKLGVSAKVVELDELADGDSLQQALASVCGRRTVPQVFIGGKHVGGCDDTVAAMNSGKLKELLAAAGVQATLPALRPQPHTMSSRPKRSHKAPKRFGAFASPEAQEVEELEEAAPLKRGRRAVAVDSESEGELAAGQPSEEEEESEGSGQEDEEEERPAARRPAKRPRAAAAAAAVEVYVPAPPAEPRPRSDMLSLLFACPALIDALLEADGLRTISLVARDAANLAAALGVSGAEAAPLWRQMARRCEPGLGADANAEQVRAAILRGIRGDIARKEVVNKSTAQGEFRLTQKELGGLPYTTRPNPIFWHAPPVKMYNKLEVLAVAHRKFGSAGGLAAAKAAAGVKSAKATQTRKSNEEARKLEMDAALRAIGLSGVRSHQLGGHKVHVKAYIKHNQGTVAGVVAAFNKQQEEDAAARRRYKELLNRLKREDLMSELAHPPAQNYMHRQGGPTLDEVVAALRAGKEARECVGERQRSVDALLAAEELQGYSYCVPSIQDFVINGEGSAEAVVAEARARRDKDEGADARRTAIYAHLEAEGLPSCRHSVAVTAYIRSGEGSEEEAVAAARAEQAEVAARTQAADARRTRISQVLAAEGLEEYAAQHRQPRITKEYISSGKGSEEAAVAAVWLCAARRVSIFARLEREGLQQWADLRAVRDFISGDVPEKEAMAAVRGAAARMESRQKRLASIEAALAAEGQSYGQLRWRVRELEMYVQDGEGSKEAALAAVRRIVQDAADKRERQELVDAALNAEGLQSHRGYSFEANSRDKYVQYGEGSVDGVVAAARKRRDDAAARAARLSDVMAAQAAAFVQADPTHWVLDATTTVVPDYRELKEVALFLTQPGVLPADVGLALYVSIGGADWSYRGFVSNSHPSDVLPLSWPEPSAPLAAPPGPGFAQIGVSVEPLAELGQKEGSKLGAKEDFAKRVGLVPSNVLDHWYTRLSNRLRRDPDFLTRNRDAV